MVFLRGERAVMLVWSEKQEGIVMNSLRILGAALVLSLMGCAADTAGDAEPIGRLDVPLVSSGSMGTQFALAATFTLAGPEAITASAGVGDADFFSQDVLTLNPRVGSYMLTISGWTLYRVSGTPAMGTPVTGAMLTSAATQAVEILNGQTTNVVYQFNVPGTGTVVFARGLLNIDFAVGEGYPDGAACTASNQCASLVCTAAGMTCAAASCSDGVQNGMETAPDVGPGCGVAGGGCSAAQQATCPAGDTCSLDATGGVVCGTFDPACTASQQALCPAGDTCTFDFVTGVTCSSGTMACSSAQFATCPADGTCSVVGGMVMCTGSALDPAAPACVKINEISANGDVAVGGGSDEFVELYNTCAITVSLAGARLVYRSAAGTSNTTQVNFATSTVIEGGGYLVYAGTGYTGPSNGTFVSGLAAAGGGLQLVYGATVFDSVGYGTATNAFIEGTVAVAPANGASISRIPNGADSNVNSVDFVAAPRTPGAAN
jgi:hypothetical protein